MHISMQRQSSCLTSIISIIAPQQNIRHTCASILLRNNTYLLGNKKLTQFRFRSSLENLIALFLLSVSTNQCLTVHSQPGLLTGFSLQEHYSFTARLWSPVSSGPVLHVTDAERATGCLPVTHQLSLLPHHLLTHMAKGSFAIPTRCEKLVRDCGQNLGIILNGRKHKQ